MLPSKNRLNIKIHFKEIRGKGKKLNTPLFSIYYCTQTQNQNPQFNAVISKKVARTAVKRNRMRRLINTALYNLLPYLQEHTQALFLVYKDFSTSNSEEIKTIINTTLQNSELYKKE